MPERLIPVRADSGGAVSVPRQPRFHTRGTRTDVDRERLHRYGAYGLALFALATSRWGSYLPFGIPPFFTDMVLFALIADRVVASATGRAKATGVDPVLGIATAAMIGWSLIMLTVGEFGVAAARDAAPYLYAITVFLVGRPGDSPSARATASRALTLALVFQATWITANSIDQGFWTHMPQFGNVFLFLPRPDFDGAVCGLLAVISLHRALSGRSPALNLGLAAWGAVLVFRTYSRASLLAFFAELLVLLMLSPARAHIAAGGRRRIGSIVVAILLVALPPAWLAAQNSLPVQRLFSNHAGSEGTSDARERSWRKIADYLDDDPARLVRGVGFGPDFLHDSKGDLELLGGANEEVRAPHNYTVNTWARLGLVGLLFTYAMLLAGWRLAFKLARAERDLTDPDVLAIMLVVALPVGATVGVILESPFGAIPYFWALGHLSTRNVQLGTVTPFGTAVRGSPAPARPVAPAATPVRGDLGLAPAALPAAAITEPALPNPVVTSPGSETQLDLNSATFDELWKLNLTRSQCTRLIATRDDRGGFSSLDELDELAGFPDEVLARLKARVRV